VITCQRARRGDDPGAGVRRPPAVATAPVGWRWMTGRTVPASPP